MLTVDMLDELEMLVETYEHTKVSPSSLSVDDREKFILVQRIVELEMELEATKWAVQKLRKEMDELTEEKYIEGLTANEKS